jgi:Small-conductance mechanosensitive channel
MASSVSKTALALIVTVLMLWSAVPATAQESPSPTVSVDQLNQLVATIEDEGRRKELLNNLQALIAAQHQKTFDEETRTVSGRLIALLTDSYSASRQSLNTAVDQLQNWPAWIEQAGIALSDPVQRNRGLRYVAMFAGIFVLGWLAEYLMWRLSARPRHMLETVSGASTWERTWRSALRVLLDLVAVAVFVATAYVAALLLAPPRPVQSVALNFVNAYAVARALTAAGRMLLSPRSEVLRPLPVADATAKRLFRWVRRFVTAGVLGYFVIAAAALLGLPRDLLPVLYDILFIVLAVMGVIFVLRHRRQFADWLTSTSAHCGRLFAVGPLLRGIAAVWHIIAIAYLAILLVIAIFDIANGLSYMLHGTLVTIAVLAATAIAISLLQPRIQHAVSAAKITEPAVGSLEDRLRGYTPFIRVGLVGVVVVAAMALVLNAWGIGAIAWFQSQTGQRAIGAALSIALTLVFAVIVWEIANGAVERFLNRGGSAYAPSARARTLLPLLRKTVVVLLTIMVVLISLSELGINIGPLLAGAGVIGLAIGFGAQKMVQDVITGFFILVEDAIAVGDVVTVAGTSGLVEDLSVRAIKLRDLSGSVHTVPFSSVDTVTNMTKTFSYYVADIGVAYKEDTDQVAQVSREVIEEMRGEPTYGASILEPLEVLGLDAFADSAVIVKVRVKTRPIKQWEVGREFNRRLKKRFDALGIEFPFPHRTIFFGSEPPTAEPVPSAPLDVAASVAPRPAARRV